MEAIENIKEGEGQSDNANVHDNGQVGLLEVNGCTCETKKMQFKKKLVTIDEAFLTRTIELQALFDKNHMSMSLQGEILRLLFGSRESLLENGEEIFYVG